MAFLGNGEAAYGDEGSACFGVKDGSRDFVRKSNADRVSWRGVGNG
jgi:hypothetical protein